MIYHNQDATPRDLEHEIRRRTMADAVNATDAVTTMNDRWALYTTAIDQQPTTDTRNHFIGMLGEFANEL